MLCISSLGSIPAITVYYIDTVHTLYSLRIVEFRVHAVVQDAIAEFRQELSALDKMKGLTSDEKGMLYWLSLHACC